jgi:hypothetical protein
VEAVWFESRRYRDGTGELPIVVCLSFCRWDVADGFEQSLVVEPGHPFQCGHLDVFAGLPGRAAMDQLGLVEPVDRLGERIVVAVTAAADRRLDARLGQTLAVANGVTCPRL